MYKSLGRLVAIVAIVSASAVAEEIAEGTEEFTHELDNRSITYG